MTNDHHAKHSRTHPLLEKTRADLPLQPPHVEPHEQRPQQQRQPPPPERAGNQPWSLLGALSISLYQSLSFSRSPSFERTRYIASTCTFIAIIYLRTLHCLFFGTGALSCAVLAKCLKHIIRQPRPGMTDARSMVDSEEIIKQGTTAQEAPIHKAPSSGVYHSFKPTPTSASSSSSSAPTSALFSDSPQFLGMEPALDQPVLDPIPRSKSPILSLAPATTLQQEQVNALNEPKTGRSSLRINRQRRRKVYFRIDYGMPSSHAQLVAFFVCYISLQLVLMEPEGSPGQWFLILLLQLYAWSVVWSRIRLGRHSVSQVLVGAGVGAVYGMVWFAIWSWKVEDMIKHWQWMDRYGVIQVRKMWRQLELDEAVAVGRAGGRMYLRRDGALPLDGQFLRY